ncbi:MAG: hypothetical protein JSR42_18790 [Proteobacteria bacterium]|nr:hypothetical protein [Pseudomonadota bacterium]MBS0553320.1 hypothetical protein [Pseudomonadota bacterium]
MARMALSLRFTHVQALSSRGNHRIRLDGEGALFVDVVTRDCPRGTPWSGDWPDVPLRQLSAAECDELAGIIRDSGFLELAAEWFQAGRDGYREEIEVTLGPRTHKVTVERAPPPAAFIRVRSAVWKLAGLAG